MPSYFVTVIDGTFNFASKADAVSPAGPAPTTSTSVLTIDIAISETSAPIALFSSQPPHSSNRVARTSISAARRALARRRELKKKARLLRRAFRRGGYCISSLPTIRFQSGKPLINGRIEATLRRPASARGCRSPERWRSSSFPAAERVS